MAAAAPSDQMKASSTFMGRQFSSSLREEAKSAGSEEEDKEGEGARCLLCLRRSRQ